MLAWSLFLECLRFVCSFTVQLHSLGSSIGAVGDICLGLVPATEEVGGPVGR